MPTQAQPLTRALVAFGIATAALFLGPVALHASNSPTDDPEMTFTGSYLAARSAAQDQDLDSAVRYLGRALQSDPDNAELLERTFVLQVINGDIDGGIELASRLLGEGNENGLASVVLGIKEIRDGDFTAAVKNFESPQTGPVAVLIVGLLKAWAQQGQGQTDQALATVAALKGPEWYAVFKDFHSALIEDVAGRQADAVAAMKEAFKSDASGLRMVEGYARTLARAGEVDTAKDALKTFAQQAQDHPIVEALLKELDSGQKPAALVASAQEGAAEALYSLGVALTGDGNNDLSAIYLELSLYLNPRDDLGWITLGDIRRANQDYLKAIGSFEKVGATSPLHEVATIEAAVSLDALDRSDEATAALNKLLADDPQSLSAALALGDILRGRKKFAEAADAYTIGINQIKEPVPTDWQLFYSRGITYERTKRWEQAEADFRMALKLNPNQPQVLNYLGYSLVDKRLKLDEALDMIRKAVGQRPEDAYIVDSLGWAYFQLGHLDDAVAELEKAVLLQPEDPVINDHLGDAYWKSGRKLEALFQWSHARDLKPEDEELPKILAKLKGGLDAVPADATKHTENETAPAVPTQPRAEVVTPPAPGAPATPAPAVQ
jgi:tetratricopeptide (TPR) repeat protein